jgi:hypothetical protein
MQRKLILCLIWGMVLLVAILLWLTFMMAVSRLVGCSLTLESGIHDSMRAENEEPRPTPTPTPAR